MTEVMQKVEGASQLANISGMNGDETTKSIQSIVNQFKLMQEEGANAGEVTSHVGDVLTAVSQNMTYDFADGIKQVNEAISESGSVAENAGVSYESFASRIGAVIEQTGKTGSEVANAYKTITARTLQVNALAEDLGISADDMANAQKALKNINISVEEGNGNLKTMDTVLNEVASKWSTLSDTQKQNIAYGMAG